jgi:DNA-binding MarR family transcriptional regulator
VTKTPGSDDVDMIEFLGAAMDVRRIIAHLLEPVARNHGLSERTLSIVVLAHAGLNRPSLLVDYLGVLPSTISSDVDKLAGLGLLRRTPSATDRRATTLEVTPAGVALQQRVLGDLRAHFDSKVAAVSTDELRACITTLHKISGGPHPDLPDELCNPSA